MKGFKGAKCGLKVEMIYPFFAIKNMLSLFLTVSKLLILFSNTKKFGI